jgi:hypothetical protein
MRSFTSPSGRTWVAQVVAPPGPSRPGSVLRFQSDSLVLELRDWPAEWESLPDDALVALVRQAQPPSLGMDEDASRARSGER